MPNLLKINNPFDRSKHEIIPIPAGITLSELRKLPDVCDGNLPLDQRVTIAIDRRVIPPEQWDTRIVHFEEYVLIVPKVADDEFIQIAAFVTLAVLAPGIGGWAAGGLGFAAKGWMATAFTIGIMVGGGMLVNALGSRPERPSMEFNEAELSQSFGWAPQTVQKQGTPKPRIYGLVKSYGNVLEAFREVTGAATNIQRLFAKIALGDGPIREPCVPGTFRVIDQPQENFSDVSYDKRYGTLSQTFMPWFEKCTAEIVEPAFMKVTNSGGAKVYETKSSDFDNLIIVLSFPGGLYDGSGVGIANHTVNVTIEVKRADASTWDELTTADITDGTTGTVIREYPTEGSLNILRGYRYQVRLAKNTADKNSDLWGDDLYIDNVKEITDEQFIHPATPLIGINAIATDELSGNIRASFHTKGRYVRVYNGAAWEIKYNNSSAWVVYDIFTQPVLTGDISPFRRLSLLLNFNGSDEATSTFDESEHGHTINFTGTAQLDTAEKKFGTASLLLDGDSDDVNIDNDGESFNICAYTVEDWTVDFFLKFTDHTGNEYLVTQREDANNRWLIYHVDGSGFAFVVNSGGVQIINLSPGGEVTDTNWHHVALCKVGDEYGLYVDGTLVSYLQDTSTGIIDGDLFIGQRGDDADWFDGHIDHLRIVQNNIFSAAPDSGLTDTITVPTEEYTDPGNSFAVSRYNCYDPSRMDLPAFEDMETWCDAARVNPDNFAIDSISKAANAIIVTRSKHNRAVGDKVLFRNVAANGMTEIADGTTANVTQIIDDYTFAVDIDSSAYSTYGIQTKLLYHFEGSDGDDFTSDSSPQGHDLGSINFIGQTHIESDEKKWGDTSCHFDGTLDWLGNSTGNSTDWDILDSLTSDWTVDTQVKHSDHAGTEMYFKQASATTFWKLYHVHGSGLKLYSRISGVLKIDTGFGGEITDTNWHHIAICKVGDDIGVYLDGTQVAYDLMVAGDVKTANTGFYISGSGEEFDGYLDEFRIIKTNAFSAAPVVGLTDTITPPTAQHASSVGSGGTVEKLLTRFSFNGIIDTTKNVWETALEVCRQCRCVPYWKGSKISIAIDKATSPSYAFTMGNTIEDSFKLMKIPADERASRIEVSFRDESKNFEKTTFIWPNASAGNARNQVRLDLFGVTHRTIAQSLADRQLKENQYVNWLIQKRVDVDAIGVLIGNVVLVQNDIANWGEIGELSQDYTGGGRIISAINGTNPTVIIGGKIKFLDADFDGGSTTYKMMVKTTGDTNETKTITGFDGDRKITLDSQFTNLPKEGNIWAAGKQNLETKQFRVMDIQLSSILQADILLKEYKSECYADD